MRGWGGEGKGPVGTGLASHLSPPGSPLTGIQQRVPQLGPPPPQLLSGSHAGHTHRPGGYGSHRGPLRAWQNGAGVEHAY